MIYSIFTLKFLAPVHFGDAAQGGLLDKISLGCSADTLFSALCNEAAVIDENLTVQFIEKVAAGKLAFSSLFPYWQDEEEMRFYLPKPLLYTEEKIREAKSYLEIKQLATKMKKQKKTAYVRASQMQALLQAAKYGRLLEMDEPEFAVPLIAGKVNLRESEPLPYYVGSYVFSERAGLYLICRAEEEAEIEFLEKLLQSLGYSGIGGKRSSGYGKFEVAEDKIELFDDGEGIFADDSALALMLYDNISEQQMCIAPICPQKQDVETVKSGYYKLLKRGGFAYSYALRDNIKCNSVYMLAEGSCLSKRLKGNLVEQVIEELPHKFYRNGMGMFVGLKDD